MVILLICHSTKVCRGRYNKLIPSLNIKETEEDLFVFLQTCMCKMDCNTVVKYIKIVHGYRHFLRILHLVEKKLQGKNLHLFIAGFGNG